MKFKLSKSSDWSFVDEIDINSLDELMKFIKENGQIIIFEDYEDEYKYEIEIYDTCRE